MKITITNHHFVLDISKDEMAIINNALNESLACIEEWEYQTRIGWSRECVASEYKFGK